MAHPTQLLTAGILLFSLVAQAHTPAFSQSRPTKGDSAQQQPPRIICAQLPVPTKPLCVVNGRPMPETFTPDAIPAKYIKEVKVLTGGAATAIGGARAANGLVLITTKRPYPPTVN
ncbi:hypothetical protein [Hymenobacter cellulosivorans]|uniref:TonB-dependent receptor plug domain-containing protein n=1 Tax=Hymenobacter cellulosivorans TaxID=2932249 RepID=A0ABY4F443_9BACT|nr:hypothetical protein [Hymenobacter cellulosivorans]UOQ51415.1 hypothetical protein MUN80_16795 [Hymenobacter cellulosivorans]